MSKEKKVYDFNLNKVKSTLVTTLKRKKNESTVADLIAATGLPKHQVEQSIKHVADEYNGHLKDKLHRYLKYDLKLTTLVPGATVIKNESPAHRLQDVQ